MLAASGLSSAQQTYRYALRGDKELKLDFYVPQQPRADRACVVYMFGGGFFSGARNDTASKVACAALAERGFYVASLDYRLGLRDVDFDTVHLLRAYRIFERAIRMSVEDCSEAVAYLCCHARELGIDTARIILTGSSAGAIAVLQTDFCRANAMPEAAKLPQGFVPAAVIPYAGAIFVDHRKLEYATPPAPTCFFHGTTDRVVNYDRFRSSLHSSLNGANKVEKVFRKNGYSHWILRFEERGHEVASYLPYTLEEFAAFADAALRGRVMLYDAKCTDQALQRTKWSKMSLFDLYLK